MKISRRQFLAANGAVLSLPFFPSIAAAETPPRPDKKLVMVYVPNGLVRRGFFPGEQDAVEMALAQATDAVLTFVQEGIDRAMNRFNRRG